MAEDALIIPAPAGIQGPNSRNLRPPAGQKGWWERLRYPLHWFPPGMGGPVDLRLLTFLVLFLNVKVAVKIPVLALACVLQPGFLRALLKERKGPAFYPLILAAAGLGWVFIYGLGNPKYDLVAGLALFSWLCCWAASVQVRLFADRTDADTLHRTIWLFFLLNAVVSLAQLIRIDWEIKALNPYLYQGMYQKYFIRTGDFISGLTFDTSTTNALINAFGVVYFLARKQGWMTLCCMACMLATGSNFTNILLLGVFAYIYSFSSDRLQKGGIILCILMGAVFLGKVSPQNQTYTEEVFSRWGRANQPAAPANPAPPADSYKDRYAMAYLNSHAAAGSSWSPKPEVPVADINSAPYQSRADTSAQQRMLLDFTSTHKADLPLSSGDELPKGGRTPGKILALQEILSFYRQHPGRVLMGNGPGNFSSKLAFRVSGLGMAGGYPASLAYIHPDFLHHHLDLYLAYFSKPKDLHSLVNSPDSTYAQMLGEYGLIGLALFLIYYLVYFLKAAKGREYSMPLLFLLAGAFFIGYWFEQLSVVVLFELLVFADRRSLIKSTVSV